MSKFKLTDNHIKLLKNSYVGWNACETGAASIDCKRPYGNGDVSGDVIRLLFGDIPEQAVEALYDYAMQLHAETEHALAIVLYTGKFEAGTYEKVGYGKEWKKL
jgi:hypothetical protein